MYCHCCSFVRFQKLNVKYYRNQKIKQIINFGLKKIECKDTFKNVNELFAVLIHCKETKTDIEKQTNAHTKAINTKHTWKTK